MAAGQDKNQKLKKNPVVITPQIQDIFAQQKQQQELAKQQQCPTVHTNHGSNVTTVSLPIQKPATVITALQPETKVTLSIAFSNSNSPFTVATTLANDNQYINANTTGNVIEKKQKNGELPQLPPRLPSQRSIETIKSTTSPTPSSPSTSSASASTSASPSPTGQSNQRRSLPPPVGPPPAIPPRSKQILRSGSVQVSSSIGFTPHINAAGYNAQQAFLRRLSVNTTPPQFTPQPPPPFVIPKRHSHLSRTISMTASTTPLTPHSASSTMISNVSSALFTSQPRSQINYGSLSLESSTNSAHGSPSLVKQSNSVVASPTLTGNRKH